MLSSIFSNPILLGLFLAVGLVLLVKGADWLVDGASSLAKRMGVSDLVIGLTIVAFGTSMPEFVVNMVSVVDGATDLAITNILGSNTINTLVILGCSAIVCPLAAQKSTVRVDVPLNILAGVLVLVFVFVTLPTEAKGLSRIEGITLILVFACFLVYTFRAAKEDAATTAESVRLPLWKCIVNILLGLTGLVVGGEMIVKSAVAIARYCGVARLWLSVHLFRNLPLPLWQRSSATLTSPSETWTGAISSMCSSSWEQVQPSNSCLYIAVSSWMLLW